MAQGQPWRGPPPIEAETVLRVKVPVGTQGAANVTVETEEICVDAAGNLFIADRGNDRIRRVDAGTTIITTFVPSSEASAPYGLAITTGGDLWWSQFDDKVVRRRTSGGVYQSMAGKGTSGLSGDGGPGLQAEFSSIFGLALDSSGNLFLADIGNHRVRRFGD